MCSGLALASCTSVILSGWLAGTAPRQSPVLPVAAGSCGLPAVPTGGSGLSTRLPLGVAEKVIVGLGASSLP